MFSLDYILDRLSGLFRFNNYPLGEKACSVMFHIAGLSLRDVSERYCVTMASRESVRRWLHRFSKIFSVDRGLGMLKRLMRPWLRCMVSKYMYGPQ